MSNNPAALAPLAPLATLAPRFHALFAGMERAHGTYTNINWDQARADGKYTGNATTKREPVTDALWEQHLAGKYGLGVIPIRDDSTCLFGAIDIDVYADLDAGRIASDIARKGFPLVPCRSKSGGLHLYLFCKVPVPAEKLQDKLREIAAKLGHGTAEIFPKQTKMGGERDLGSWLNAPYQDVANTKRYAVRPGGDAMTAEEFLTAAETAKQAAEWFSQPLAQNTDCLPDGPPCLNHLIEIGIPPGTWNTVMFNTAIYFKKAHPNDWKDQLVQVAAKVTEPKRFAGHADELQDMKKSLTKKDFAYACSKHPLLEHCSRKQCWKRKHGVDKGGELPVLSSLSQLLTDPPLWFLEIEGHRLELTTEELMNPIAFQIKCANKKIAVQVVGRAKWTKYIGPFITKANEIPITADGTKRDDGSLRETFVSLLERFCNDRAQANSLEQMRALHKPYTADGVTKFCFGDFVIFLSQKKLANFQQNKAYAMLRELGGKTDEKSVSGLSTRFWIIPAFAKADKLPDENFDSGNY